MGFATIQICDRICCPKFTEYKLEQFNFNVLIYNAINKYNLLYSHPGNTHCCGAGAILAGYLTKEMLAATIALMKQGLFIIFTPNQINSNLFVRYVVNDLNNMLKNVGNIKYEQIDGLSVGLITVEVTGNPTEFYDICNQISGVAKV